MDFQKLISELEATQMSQGEIAKAIGVTQGRISQVVRTNGAGLRGVATVKLLELHQMRCQKAAA